MLYKCLLLIISIIAFKVAHSQSEQTIKNITTFSKAYGYVKYFHPSDEANTLDWNMFSAYGVKAVEKCKNDKELVKVLNKIFHEIAPTAKFVLKADKTDFDANILIPDDTTDFKQIYWQHRGVSFNTNNAGMKDAAYQSVRVNRLKSIDKSSRIGNLFTIINPTKYRGKKIKYVGWASLEANSEGHGQFWLRVDRSNKICGFFDNHADNPVKSHKWKKFEIIGDIAQDAQSLVFGYFLSGKGALYVDNVKLYYYDNDEWIEIPIANSDFEIEGVSTDRKSKSVWKGFGRGYSFTQQNVIKTSGDKAVKIEYVGFIETTIGKQLFDCRPAFGEIIENEIGENIYCQIPLVLFANKSNTYPQANVAKYKKRISKINKIKNGPSSIYVRLGNVVNTYNIFEHFYPYFDVVNVDWHTEFRAAIAQSFVDKNAKDHLLTLQKFTAKLHDGHINVRSRYNDSYIPPILWEWVENKLVITYVKDKNLPIKRGDIVEKVDGKLPDLLFMKVKGRISAATDAWLNYKASYISLFGAKASIMQIQINSKQYELSRDYTYQQVVNSDDIFPAKYKLYNDSSIVYLNLDIIEMDTINYLMPVLQKSKAIICDLRGYPNGNDDFINHLLKEDAKDSLWLQIPEIIYPDYKNLCGFVKEGWMMEAKQPYLGGKRIVFITDGQAISYAESYLGYIKGYNLATIVGQPTAGTNGNVNPFSLMGGYTISWTGMKVVKHDGSQHHGVGILPDVQVEKTIKGVRENRDEFLEKAFELID